MATYTLAKALNDGLRAAMDADPKVLVMGEDVGKLGGVFRVTDGLQKDFGEDRVIDTPLAESGIVGTAIGLALRGYRPVCEIQFDGFIYPAYDQIVSQLAKMGNRSRGQVKLPVVVRVPFGGGIGAVEHHSESPEAYFAHTAGLRIVSPTSPADAYWMIQQAVASDDPVMFFEPKRRYWEKGELDPAAGPQLGLHEARVVRPGEHVTVAAYGPMVRTAVEVGQVLLLEAARGVRRVEAADPQHRRLEGVEAALRHPGRDLGAEPQEDRRLVDHHQPPGPLDRRDEGVEVERRQRAQVDHLDVPALLGRSLGGLERRGDHPAVGDERDVAAGPADDGLVQPRPVQRQPGSVAVQPRSGGFGGG